LKSDFTCVDGWGHIFTGFLLDFGEDFLSLEIVLGEVPVLLGRDVVKILVTEHSDVNLLIFN
jgi:hypothetical protein